MLKALVIILPVVIGVLIYIARRSGYSKTGEGGSSLGARILLASTGLVMGGAGAFFFLVTVKDPQTYFFSGFILGPMLVMVGFYALIVALFFPADTVKGMIEHYFKNT